MNVKKILAAALIGALVYGGVILLVAGAVTLSVMTGEAKEWPLRSFAFGVVAAPFLALGAVGMAWGCVQLGEWWERL